MMASPAVSSPSTENMDLGMRTNEQLSFLICLHSLVTVVKSQACGAGLTLTFAKIPNMLPRTPYPPVLLYAQAPGVAITATCYNRCKETPNCDGFIMDYKQGACYRVNVGRQYEDYQFQPTVNFFRKVCLRLPRDCIQRAWPVEFIPGYKLLAEQTQVLPNVADKWMCAQMCFNGSAGAPPCRSAQYQAWSRTCTLSQFDRHTNPESFAPSVASDREFDYMENQCPVFLGYTPEGQPATDEYCWHDPIYNKTSLRSDMELDNLSEKQCEWRCQTEASFRCVAYTYQCPVYGNRISRCILHSDEVTSRVSPLVPLPCTTYRERISCLDMSIQCSPASIVVTLREKMFGGQIFVKGHAYDCVAANNGQDRVTLVIPLPQSDYIRNKCDVQIIKGIGNQNRSVATTTIVVQHHRLIQTASDRVVKVSCYLDTNSGPSGPNGLPQPGNNLTLNASFYVKDPIPVQNIIEGYGSSNNATYPPSAEMRVVDVGRGGVPASETELGDELELQIFVNPNYNVSMIRAGHLIASSGSGQDSLLLLDWRGCPPDPTTFPPLTAVNNSALIARFRAFKFPDSNIIRFSVILTFCITKCQPTDCGNGLTSYGKRRRRSLPEDTIFDEEEPLLISMHDRRWRRALDDIMEEIPLQLELVVMTPGAKTESPPNPHLSDDDITNGTSRSATGELVCASLGTSFMIGIAWIVIQILLLIGCCWALGRHEKRPSDRVRLETDFQPKHVSWGDSLTTSTLGSGRLPDRNQTSTIRS